MSESWKKSAVSFSRGVEALPLLPAESLTGNPREQRLIRGERNRCMDVLTFRHNQGLGQAIQFWLSM